MPEEITNIYELFRGFPWHSLLVINEQDHYVKIANSEDYILIKEGDFIKIEFFDFDQNLNNFTKKSNYLTLFIHVSLNIIEFINYWSNEERNSYGYSFSREYPIFKKIIEGINSIKISPNYSRAILKRNKSLLIQPSRFKDIQSTIQNIDKRANSVRNSLVNFLANQAKFNFINKSTQKITSITKGEFDFLVHRLNLSTKKHKKDFLERLNNDDINSLGNLFDEMIKKEVFDDDYIRRLDDYFIKEKLENIITDGKKILDLKSDNIKIPVAKKLIKKLFNEDIRQLETVWQRYFEKYLLYLFFSYKKIIPKIELKNLENLDKEYPDFVGVNHYDSIDIIEIKTHLKNILVWDSPHNNFAFSSEMSKALIQTINYMDAISDDKIKKTKDRRNLLEYLNINENLYRPKGIIIISSKEKICKNQSSLKSNERIRLNKDFTKLRNSIHNIQIFTFDEILSIAQRYLENIKINK